MKNAIRILSFITFSLLPTALHAQMTGGGALLQGGPWAQGHSPMYVGQGSSQAIVMDSGPASGGGNGVGLSEQLLTARGMGTPPFVGQGSGPFGTNWCDYDAPTTNPTGYHFLCLGPNVNGNSYIATGPGGIATPGGLTFNINGIITTYTGQMPTVFSVGAEFTGGLISVSGSPITTSGTFDFTVAGNSGGIPYFDSPTSWNTTPTLAAGFPLIGGGVGLPPSVAAKSGNTTTFGTTSGSLLSGDCVSIDANGNLIDAGGPCTTGGGGGTVSPSTANNMAYYQVTGTTVTGLATANNGVLVTSNTGVPSIGTTLPSLVQGNITSVGTISSGTWHGSVIGATFGGTGLSAFTSGGLLYSPTTTTIASSAALSNGLPVIGQGAGSAPTTGTKSGNTTKFVTTTGTLTSGNCAQWDISGNAIDAGITCNGIIFPGTDGGTPNAHTIASTGYTFVANNIVSFVATTSNTGAATANVNGTGVKSIFEQTPTGPAALSGGEIVTGNVVQLVSDGTRYQILNPADGGSSGGQAVPMASGLIIKYPGSTTTSTVTSNFIQMVSSVNGSAFTVTNVSLSLNASTGGLNGLDIGSPIANQPYYIWAISNGTTTGGLISLSSSSPIMPSGYTYKARIGAVFTDSGANFVQLIQVGARAQYINFPVIATASSTVSTSSFIPSTAKIINAQASVTSPSSNTSVTVIPSNTASTAILSAANGTSTPITNSYGEMIVNNSSPSLIITKAGSGNVSVFCVGWTDSIIAF